jgi:serine/threonine protein kinase
MSERRHDNRVAQQCTYDAILWGQLSHPNLLPFYGLYQFRSRACIVLPWVDNGHMIQFLRQNPDVDRILLVRDFDTVCSFRSRSITHTIQALDVVEGIGFLHEEGIIHGNLRGVSYLFLYVIRSVASFLSGEVSCESFWESLSR